MTAPGSILLVSCYELGHQPQGLASPLAHLIRAGYHPAAVDTAIEPLDDDAIRAARLVGISVPMHTALRLGVRVAERVRALNPHAHICFYGHYALLNAAYLLDGVADSVIGGEYEQPLLDLVHGLGEARPLPAGVATRAAGATAFLGRAPSLPGARETLPPLSRYARLMHDGQTRLSGYVETTRGCLHVCRHCPLTPVYGGRLVAVPAETVLADIRAQVSMGAEHISFGDPDFMNGPGHALRITRALHEEFPWLTFDATIKVEHILERAALMPELRHLGCVFVVSAIESLSDVVLARLQKGHTRAQVAQALAVLDEAGIPPRPTWLPFTPWATLEDVLDILKFVAAHHLIEHIDPVQYSIRLLIPPDSPLADDLAANGELGPLDPGGFTYQWTHPDPRIDRLQGEIAAIGEEAERAGRDPLETFRAIAQAAYAAAKRPGADHLLAGYTSQAPPPRLSESWFC